MKLSSFLYLFLIMTVSAKAGWFSNPWGSSKISREESRQRQVILSTATSLIGSPYRWDHNGPTSFDCSGFVHYVLRRSLGEARFDLPYTLAKMKGYKNQSVYYRDYLRAKNANISCDSAVAGDVIFFYPKHKGENHHIGVISDTTQKLFISAQSVKHGVAEHSYHELSYWGHRPLECYKNIWVGQ